MIRIGGSKRGIASVPVKGICVAATLVAGTAAIAQPTGPAGILAPAPSLEQAIARRVDEFARANGATRDVRDCAETNRSKPAQGDLDGDGISEAAIYYNVIGCGGGTHTESEVAVFRHGPAGWVHAAGLAMPEDVTVDSVAIRGGRLLVATLAYGANDPRCCPSLKRTLKYRLADGRLVDGAAGAAPTPGAGRAGAGAAASTFDRLFAGIEHGCEVRPELDAFIRSVGRFDDESTTWRLSSPPFPPAYRDAFTGVRMRDAGPGKYTEFVIDTVGSYHGIPLTRLIIDKGNGNGIFRFAIELDRPLAQAKTQLTRELRFEQVMYEPQGEPNGVTFAAQGARTVLTCELSV
jgi:hypothetical protein